MKRAKIEVKVNGKVSLLKIIQTIYRMECDPSFLKFVKTDLSLAKKKKRRTSVRKYLDCVNKVLVHFV